MDAEILKGINMSKVVGTVKPVEPSVNRPCPDMVWIPGGVFRMGSEDFYSEERPVHRVSVGGFWIDRFQ
jgi:sulfatase modifying factor 1